MFNNSDVKLRNLEVQLVVKIVTVKPKPSYVSMGFYTGLILFLIAFFIPSIIRGMVPQTIAFIVLLFFNNCSYRLYNSHH